MWRTNEELKWLGIDLDGVISDTKAPEYKLGDLIPGAKEAMDKLESDGWKLIIYTARPWADYEEIESWLNEKQIPFRRIVCGKLLVKFLIDDRCIGFKNWDDTLNQIQ